MNYTITNEKLSVTIDSYGSQLLSIKTNDGHEYMWQRDEKYWKESAPVIFPFVARLVDKTYYIDGKKYVMDNHGFARNQEYEVEKISDNEIIFSINENEETLKAYPRKFQFSLIYKLVDNKLYITYKVVNNDDKMMYFGLGGHPGFNVPLKEGLTFEDYYIEYETCDTQKVIFTDTCFVDKIVPYKLDNKRIYLKHNIFDDDAIFLKGGHKATLKTDKDNRLVTINYPNMDYFGIWHRVKSDAPYVCLEPWLSLPAKKEGETVFESEEGLIHLKPNDVYENTYSIEIE